MIIRVNMTTKQIEKQTLPGEYILKGGRSLTSSLILDEVNPACDPLGPNNKLVMAPGLLGGTTAPCSGRISIGAKSPLTGGIKESNGGGTAGTKLARMGIKALVIEGQPREAEWYFLRVSADGVEILSAPELEGLGNYDTADILLRKYGADKSVISIGPAGERGSSMATVAITDMEGRPTRHCGRGGMGAVMGSKKIKAIIVDDGNAPVVSYVNAEKFKKTARDWARELVPARKTMTEYGTASLVSLICAMGALPTRNFSSGKFEQADHISGERLRQILDERGGVHGHPCHPGCVIRCSNIYKDENGEYVTSSLEFETIGLIGANCGIGSLDFIAGLDRFCDDFGIDTMEFGVTLGVIMEAGLAPFGDEQKVLEIVEELKKNTILGKLIAQGAYITGKVLGVRRIPAVKGQAISSYDPRVLKGTGVTYATSPMGADHTAGNLLPGRKGYRPLTRNGFDLNNAQGQYELSRDIQVMTAVCDYCGLCFFVGPTPENMEVIAGLLNARYGVNLTADDLIKMSKEMIKTEVRFNQLAGISQEENGLPEFFSTEKLDNCHVFDVPAEKLKEIYKDGF